MYRARLSSFSWPPKFKFRISVELQGRATEGPKVDEKKVGKLWFDDEVAATENIVGEVEEKIKNMKTTSSMMMEKNDDELVRCIFSKLVIVISIMSIIFLSKIFLPGDDLIKTLDAALFFSFFEIINPNETEIKRCVLIVEC